MSTSPGPKAGPGPSGPAGPSPAAATTAAAATTTTTTVSAPNEEELRRQLRSLMQELKQRAEPLDPTYRHLLMNGVVTRRKPQLPKNKFYKRIGSQLRQRVETFCVENQGKDPWTDCISQRQVLEEDKMQAALQLREFKEHEQQPLLAATLAALPRRHGMDEMTRRRYLDGVALGLTAPKKMRRTDVSAAAAAAAARFGGTGTGTTAAAEQTEQARQAADHKRLKEQTKAREAARRQREEEERQRRALENKNARHNNSTVYTQQQALYKAYHPIFKLLWDMEFPYLCGTNPFRIVINRENCASVGAPDYFDVIDEPMNLTYIQQKVENMEYKTLASFFDDVELLIRNALTYNSDPNNPYRKASEELQKKYKRAQKRVLMKLQQLEQQQQAAANAK